jgi:hypothetical protein
MVHMRATVVAFGVVVVLTMARSAEAQSHTGHAQHGSKICPDPRLQASADSGFAALQKRGQQGMGVDQYTTQHQFESLADGGRIIYESSSGHAAEVAQIRKHLGEIALAFAAGDFSTPAFIHDETVPGTPVMAERREAIEYELVERPLGAELRLATRNAEVLHAIHAFMAYQRIEHHTC